MNDNLKKKPKTDYQKKYLQNKRMVCVCLDKQQDEDIIEWIESQPSMGMAIKRVLRYHINGRQ